MEPPKNGNGTLSTIRIIAVGVLTFIIGTAIIGEIVVYGVQQAMLTTMEELKRTDARLEYAIRDLKVNREAECWDTRRPR